jgi:hypothetical protein
MIEKQRRYKFDDYLLRERKGRYYVYKLEYENGDAKETYVGPLADVAEKHIKLKDEIGGVGYPPQSRGRDLNPGPLPYQGSALARLSYRGIIMFNLQLVKKSSSHICTVIILMVIRLFH